MLDQESIPKDRFYAARFLLGWAARETRELSEVIFRVGSVEAARLRARPLAVSVVANLRTTLEYVAQATAAEACPKSRPERVSFPIAQDIFAFRSMMATRFPGLRTNHPGVWEVFLQVQQFSPNSDDWLSTLHGLWNRTIAFRFHGGSIAGEDDGTGDSSPRDSISGRTGLRATFGTGGELMPFLHRVELNSVKIMESLDRALDREAVRLLPTGGVRVRS